MSQQYKSCSSFSEEWWRVTLSSIGDGVIATDAQGKVSFLNSVAEGLTGWTQEAVEGRPLAEVFHIVNEASGARVENPVQKVLENGHVVGLANHTILITEDGRRLPIDDSAAPIRDDRGELVGVVLIFRDISERREIELAQAYLAAIVESSSDAIISKTLDGVITSWNKGAQQIFGYSAEEAIGRNVTMLFPPERQSEEIDILGKMRRGERIDHYETIRRTKDGRNIVISLSDSPIKDSIGNVIGVSKNARDITDRKQAEEAMRVAQEHLELVANNMASAVTRCSRDLCYLWVSPVYAKWLRKEPQEIAGRKIVDVIGNEGYAAIRPHIEQVLSGKKEEYEELVNFQGLGSRWIHAVYVPTKDGADSVNGWVAVVTDITDRKEMEHERERSLEREHEARARAEEASKLKDEFLATMSHELRTPLHAMLGWTRVLQSGNLGQEEARQAIATIERNAITQAQLIEDLLDVSRIITGKLRLDVRRVMVSAVIESAVASLILAAEAKDVQIQRTLDPNAGSVSGDAGRLQQVVWNLLSNAIKFTPRGGRVQIRLERINSHIEITVSDTGQGISHEFLPYVFERFRQGDAGTTRQHGGLGVGLAIVRQVVELHGGTVSADSPGEGKGSRFAVRLPLLVVPATNDEEERVQPKVERKALLTLDHLPNLHGVTVLLIDDDADTRKLLHKLLEQCGAEVQDAASAEVGLAEAKRGKPSIIVCDIGMPREDGYQFIEKFRAWEQQCGSWTPAVALTAYARAEDRVRALVAGYQIHVAKPIEPVELALVVARQLGRGR